MWGGTEMSSTENGDFMHFDLRNTTYGHQVLSAHDEQVGATDAAVDAKAAVKVKADAAAAAKAAKDAGAGH